MFIFQTSLHSQTRKFFCVDASVKGSRGDDCKDCDISAQPHPCHNCNASVCHGDIYICTIRHLLRNMGAPSCSAAL